MTLDEAHLLDNTGWLLLQALQEDARLSYKELAARVGLSAPAVAERIRKLEDAGVITGYHAELDLKKVGMPITAYIRLSTPRQQSGRVGAHLQAIPEILECARVAGPDSFIMKVGVASMDHLESLIDHLAQYGESVTSITLSTPVARRIIAHQASRSGAWADEQA